MTTSNAPAATTPVATAQLQPYIFFYGRCEEALQFYKEALGGSYESMYVKDTPVAEQFPPEASGKVMHASFTAPGIAFFASDGREEKTIDPDAGNIAMALSFTDGPEGERVFNALSAGGKVTMPLDKAFWGGRFVEFVDRFGIDWMMTLP
jgi:PhnB protein